MKFFLWRYVYIQHDIRYKYYLLIGLKLLLQVLRFWRAATVAINTKTNTPIIWLRIPTLNTYRCLYT